MIVRSGVTSLSPVRKNKKSTAKAVLGSPNWARTSDIMINSHALYRLSYRGLSVKKLLCDFSHAHVSPPSHSLLFSGAYTLNDARYRKRYAQPLLFLGGFATQKTVINCFLLATTSLSRIIGNNIIIVISQSIH